MSARQAKHVIIHLESNRENATYFPSKYTNFCQSRTVIEGFYWHKSVAICTNCLGVLFLLLEVIFDEKILFYKHFIT